MMYFKLSSLFSLLLLNFPSLSTSSPSPQSQARAVSLPLPNHVVHQFPNPTWLENLAFRSDNTLLTTSPFPSASVYLVDPSDGSSTLVHNFPSVLALIGITELGHDKFYIAGGNFSLKSFTSVNESYSIFEVDMQSFDCKTGSGAQVKKIVDIPEAAFLNGATPLSRRDHTILVADSALGVVFKVDVAAGTYNVAIDIPEMKAPGGPGLQIGVNGIKVRDGWLYFSNSGNQSLNRVKIYRNGTVHGAVEVLATGLGLLDDFTIDEKGRVWIALNSGNQLGVLVPGSDKVVTVLGVKDQLTLPGPTSCMFGRRGLDEVLFVATSGGLAAPINGTLTEGGKIVAVDTKGF